MLLLLEQFLRSIHELFMDALQIEFLSKIKYNQNSVDIPELL